MSAAAVALRGLTKSFGSLTAVDGVDLEIAPGSFVALLGPSGCGKTTTLRMLVGLEEPSAGAIEIDGEDVSRLPAGRRGVGLVFQDFAIFPHMSVRENLAFAPRMAGEPPEEIERRVDEAAAVLELSSLLPERPARLNASELQRVSIGRTLVSRPDIILFDEPLSNVEAGLRARMRGELKRLHRRFRQTAVYVTHDQVEAMALADLVAVMDRGRLVQVGAPEQVYDHPASTFVAGFIGSPPMNLLDALATETPGGLEAQVGSLRLPLPPGLALAPGDALTVGVRPEGLALASKPGSGALAGRGRLVALEPVGAETIHIVDGEGWSLTAVSDAGPTAAVDEMVSVSVRSDAVHAFGADGMRLQPSPQAVGAL